MLIARGSQAVMKERLLHPLARPKAWSRALGLMFVMVLLAGCGDSTGTRSIGEGVHRASLTGNAALSLDQAGRLLLANQAPGEIGEAQAKQLAMAWWHDARPFVIQQLEADRGGSIAETLQPCARAYYAHTAYATLPPAVPLVLRKVVGSQWLVGLCSGETEQVVIAVSAQATDTKPGNGRRKLDDAGAGNFVPMGVPVGVEIPVSPERVADAVYQQTGRRVAAVPQLVQQPFPQGPLVALWEVSLEAPVTLKGKSSGEVTLHKSLLAGAGNGWQTPALIIGRDDASSASAPSSNAGAQGSQVDWPAALGAGLRTGLSRSLELATVEGN